MAMSENGSESMVANILTRYMISYRRRGALQQLVEQPILKRASRPPHRSLAELAPSS